MSYKKLQIKLLSKSGELINVVNCVGGKVTVLRANTHAELQPYQRALSGVPGPEKFSLNLDGQEFRAEEHTLLGFGRDLLESHTVADYLASFGVPRTAIKSVLMSYGLEQFATENVQSIGTCAKRRVQLLAATYTPDKVLILNNPFQPISNEWKDAFAELVLTFSKNKSAIVVVTSLSYRPQSWIGNELIARMQVGSTLQRTIGFGSDQDTMREMLEQVRSTAKQETSQAEERKPLHTASSSASSPQAEMVSSSEIVKRASQSWMGIAFVLCTLSLSLGAGGLWYLKSSREDELAKIVEPQVDNTAEETSSNGELAMNIPANTDSSIPDTNDSQEPPIDDTGEVTQPIPDEVKPELAMVLDAYTPSIKKTVLATFNGQLQRAPVAAKREPMSKRIESKHASPKGFDLLSALEQATGTGKGLPDYIPESGNASTRTAGATTSSSDSRPDFNSMSKEERRALLREKFRQAIERAQQRKQEQE